MHGVKRWMPRKNPNRIGNGTRSFSVGMSGIREGTASGMFITEWVMQSTNVRYVAIFV